MNYFFTVQQIKSIQIERVCKHPSNVTQIMKYVHHLVKGIFGKEEITGEQHNILLYQQRF